MFAEESIISSGSSSCSTTIDRKQTSWTDDTVDRSGSDFFPYYCPNSSSTDGDFISMVELDGFVYSSFSVGDEDSFVVF